MINPIFYPYISNEGFIALLGIVFCLSRLVGSLSGGIYLDKSQRYLFVLYSTLIFSTIVSIMMMREIPMGKKYISLMLVTLFGLFSGPIVPIAFDFSIRLTYPIQPALVNGMLQMIEEVVEFFVSNLFVFLS